jgi:ketosteroid isomerase-like protein
VSKNVEIVQRGIYAFNRRDVDLVAELTTPDFAWFPAMAEAVEAGVYRGREGIEAYFADLSKTWEELRILPGLVHDLGDRVLVLGRIEGRGVGSGVPVDAPLGLVYELRGGKIAVARGYFDHGEARKAVGLAPRAPRRAE